MHENCLSLQLKQEFQIYHCFINNQKLSLKIYILESTPFDEIHKILFISVPFEYLHPYY